jgi:acyl carrier protein
MLFSARAFLWKERWFHGREGIIAADFCGRRLVFIVIIDSVPLRYQMSDITPGKVRQFLLARYARSITELGLDPAKIPDNFDFLLSGVIDSFGILELVSSLEDEFRIQLNMSTLDAEQITILGPLSLYVAENAKADLSAGG